MKLSDNLIRSKHSIPDLVPTSRHAAATSFDELFSRPDVKNGAAADNGL